ncbi:hypothetical protein [Paenibacillus planticolens]|uniref:Uncharacterized protein n=1 Tax=Paenibacillus planticolens TaxID=2654976 RepID=A0ABX1ZFB9_9BACL|nr:hypothetical protein [Paenibacillus planticolens]NOU98785.1 hypothetical protein [Paenibacillus planticolens]
MKIGGITLFICGIFLFGISGLEKVLIYIAGAISFKFTEMEQLKNFTPPDIWNLVNYTLIISIILCIAGLVLFVLYLNSRYRKVD